LKPAVRRLDLWASFARSDVSHPIPPAGEDSVRCSSNAVVNPVVSFDCPAPCDGKFTRVRLAAGRQPARKKATVAAWPPLLGSGAVPRA
jgi:hypothetical protein